MRTTLTLDEDVAKKLKRLARNSSFKQVVNDALRAGLHVMESGSGERRYRTRSVIGEPKLPNLDDVAEVLAVAEGEDRR